MSQEGECHNSIEMDFESEMREAIQGVVKTKQFRNMLKNIQKGSTTTFWAETLPVLFPLCLLRSSERQERLAWRMTILTIVITILSLVQVVTLVLKA